MSSHLLDVNVLIALLDPDHVQYERAHRWFERSGRETWLSSPTTENGVLRIVSHPRYPNVRPMAAVIDSLESLLTVGGHVFIPDSLSLLGDAIDRKHLLSSGQVTDTYLLALAKANRARLATFDRRLVTTAVAGGSESVTLIA